MANMFERAAKAYDAALDLSSGDYLDALVYRASTLIILGRYEEAARNYARAMELDTNRLFVDVYTGLAKVLVAKEEVVDGGWKTLVDVIETELPQKETQLAGLSSLGNQQQAANTKSVLVDAIKRMHLAMFSYHDTKTKDAEKAWEHLSSAYRHKMSILPPWNGQQEANRVAMVKQIFQPGFWPEHVGSDSQTPIFVIGFVRSGSTLLERILDAHSQIVGTGEDSMFNGQLDTIRNKIVQASTSGNPMVIQRTVQALADKVVDDMTARFWSIENATAAAADQLSSNERIQKADPKRFVDKMLTNYMNVGFIHMLFPQALILHVSREPMDCVFSAYKHDFPPGTLDYTSDFPSLAQLYLGYREMMEHWDRALPGRVTHVRYEDMVEDLPAVARALIDATGLPWEEDVLDFHKKKQAVNTLSTSQVRKGMYKDHFKAWKKYEKELQPLVELLGDKVEHVVRTTIPGYEQS
jgi:tetratricopeptide (TPR) repeat protein